MGDLSRGSAPSVVRGELKMKFLIYFFGLILIGFLIGFLCGFIVGYASHPVQKKGDQVWHWRFEKKLDSLDSLE